MIHRIRRGRRAGFTLTEMLCVLIALTAGLAIGAGLLLTATRAGHGAEAAGNQLSHRLELARLFRTDVHRAESAPDKRGDTTAGPTVLILAMPGGGSVIYRWENDALERIESTAKGETRQLVPSGGKDVRIEFDRSRSGLVTVRATPVAKPIQPRGWELSAAIGGSRR